MAQWTTTDIPPQRDRSVVVTGTGGLGFEDGLALARAGADITLAGRNRQKGMEAVARIRAELPQAKIGFEELDLANLQSVADFAGRFAERRQSLDVLINNAGVMVPPTRQETKDGFELQLGTNYLGHFALTAQLMPLLKKGRDPRVISLGSVAARQGQINFADLQSSANYVPMEAYSQSKIACVMFALELQRRSLAGQWGVTSLAAHPGISRTDLLHNAPGKLSAQGLARTWLWFLFQPAWQGALPTLFAATSKDAVPGAYYGPHALGETRGYPAPAKLPPQALDASVARRLFEESERLTRVSFGD